MAERRTKSDAPRAAPPAAQRSERNFLRLLGLGLLGASVVLGASYALIAYLDRPIYETENWKLSALDRRFFFNSVARSLFAAKFEQSQVDGLNALLDDWDRKHRARDLRWLAYALATVYHETARAMQPIEEFGKGEAYEYGKPDPATGKKYYGRGLVQLTWKDNYARVGRKIGVDLVKQPDLALNPAVARRILYEGMMGGWFARCALPDFFTPRREDWLSARCIVNGDDKAAEIADYARAFRAALKYKEERAR